MFKARQHAAAAIVAAILGNGAILAQGGAPQGVGRTPDGQPDIQGIWGTDADAADMETGLPDDETATLRVKLPPKAREGEGRMVKHGTVHSSAKPIRDVVVQLFSSDPDELQVPPTVILPAGRNSTDFDLSVVDDDRIDGTRTVTISAHVENWVDGNDMMSIVDNDAPALFVLLPTAVSEGNGVLTNAGRIRLSWRLPTDLFVSLKSSDLSELRVPASVVVLAGKQGRIRSHPDRRCVDPWTAECHGIGAGDGLCCRFGVIAAIR